MFAETVRVQPASVLVRAEVALLPPKALLVPGASMPTVAEIVQEFANVDHMIAASLLSLTKVVRVVAASGLVLAARLPARGVRAPYP
jgi:hypothetical protein